MRIYASTLITGGIILLACRDYQLFNTNQGQKKTLAEAEEKIQQARELSEQIDPIKEAAKFKAEHGEEVGILQIPRLDAYLPIVEGVDEDDLAQEIGRAHV